ncbi:hypothetical protein [Psychromonas hadalis]|uniref:hypothetical protein n=1 Tax=Psychromonas hadalis TaxID=211669 RepID=UPI0003B7B219|nr:hypothetical protein [Psychromonas hadalis]
MSAKKHKRKAVKHVGQAYKKVSTPSLLHRYPRLGLVLSFVLLVVGILLLTIGYVSNARVGLAMISLFFGLVLGVFSNAALPQQRSH